jgi:putative ABC transport system substrate-binding protein
LLIAVVNDPLGQGFVASLARPGGNITGFALIEFSMVGKWLELLKEMAPGIKRVALMFNPQTAPYYAIYLREFGTVPATLAGELAEAPVRDEAEIEAAIAAIAREPAGGLIAAADPFTVAHRALIMRLAQHHRLPAVYALRQFVTEGGLMSYGPDTVDPEVDHELEFGRLQNRQVSGLGSLKTKSVDPPRLADEAVPSFNSNSKSSPRTNRRLS